METIEENLVKCLENLRIDKYSEATSNLYPVSKRTTGLGMASDNIVSSFVTRMVEVLEVFEQKLRREAQMQDKMAGESARFILMDAYRILRTSCTANAQVKEEFGGAQGVRIMECTQGILDSACQLYSGESLIQALAVGIQFLFHLAAWSHRNQDLVWDHFRHNLLPWLEMPKYHPENSIKIVNYACGVIDGCLPRQWKRNEAFLNDQMNFAIILNAVKANAAFPKMEFGKKAMVEIVQIPDVVKALYEHLEPHERVCLLESMLEVIGEVRRADERGTVPPLQTGLQFLVESFINSRSVFNADTLAPKEASPTWDLYLPAKTLEVLSQATCCRTYANDISNFTLRGAEEPNTLLTYALDLLKNISKKGSFQLNMLSRAKNATEVEKSHPGYLLRRDLIRVIGNLSYENKRNQDTVREALNGTGIALIIDHIAIDERNPFMKEWAQLALINLVRDNEENASFVKGLKLQGAVDSSGILQDCGLTLETKDDKVTVKSHPSMLTLAKLAEKAPPRP